jgi:hypothetical protein
LGKDQAKKEMDSSCGVVAWEWPPGGRAGSQEIFEAMAPARLWGCVQPMSTIASATAVVRKLW